MSNLTPEQWAQELLQVYYREARPLSTEYTPLVKLIAAAIAAAQAEAARAQMEADCAAVCKLCQSSEDHDTAERANEMLWRHRGKTRHGNGYDHGVCAASPIRAAYAAANPEPQP